MRNAIIGVDDEKNMLKYVSRTRMHAPANHRKRIKPMKHKNAVSLIFVGLALAATPSLAQEKKLTPAAELGVMTMEQQRRQDAALDEIAVRIDRGVELGFRGRERLRQDMEIELKEIAEINGDASALSKAITTFQTRFAPQYRDVLKAGGVDLDFAARQMSAAVSGMTFTVVDGTHIRGQSAEPDAKPPAPPPPAASRTRIRGRSMDSDSVRSCGAISDARILVENDGVNNSVWAAKLGGCTQTSVLKSFIPVQRGLTGTISGSATVDLKAFAVGLGGAAWAASNVSAVGSNLAGADPFGQQGGGYSTRAFAPLFWVSQEAQGPTTFRFSGVMGYPPNVVATAYSVEVKTSTYAKGVGIVWANANAKAIIRNIDFTINLAP
jgi:hypothetical protein